MTPLHFRVWFPTTKTMFDAPADNIALGLNGVLHDTMRDHGHLDDRETAWSIDEPVIVMQSTGLTDKNRKEIFEGDIVEGYTVCGLEAGEVVFGKYVTDNKANEDIMAWCFSCKERYHALDPQCTWEIIGNIHENPDLL